MTYNPHPQSTGKPGALCLFKRTCNHRVLKSKVTYPSPQSPCRGLNSSKKRSGLLLLLGILKMRLVEEGTNEGVRGRKGGSTAFCQHLYP